MPRKEYAEPRDDESSEVQQLRTSLLESDAALEDAALPEYDDVTDEQAERFAQRSVNALASLPNAVQHVALKDYGASWFTSEPRLNVKKAIATALTKKFKNLASDVLLATWKTYL